MSGSKCGAKKEWAIPPVVTLHFRVPIGLVSAKESVPKLTWRKAVEIGVNSAVRDYHNSLSILRKRLQG